MSSFSKLLNAGRRFGLILALLAMCGASWAQAQREPLYWYSENTQAGGYRPVAKEAEACAAMAADWSDGSDRWRNPYVREWTYSGRFARDWFIECGFVWEKFDSLKKQWYVHSSNDYRAVGIITCEPDTVFPKTMSLDRFTHSCVCKEGKEWSAWKNACVDVLEKSGNKAQCEPAHGKPILPLTGSKRLTIELGQWLGMPVTLHYSTRRQVDAAGTEVALQGLRRPAIPLPMLDGMWETSLHRQMKFGTNAVSVYRGQGQWQSFTKAPNGSYVSSDPEVTDWVASGSSWTLYDQRRGTLEVYTARSSSDPANAGVLEKMQTKEGRQWLFSYDSGAYGGPLATAKLIKVADQFGRFFTLSYQSAANGAKPERIATITDPVGNVITFGYDEKDRFNRITWPDQSTRQFLYEREDLPWAITGVINENGKRYVSYAYDTKGYAIDTQTIGGVDHHSATWTKPPRWSVTESYDADNDVVWRTSTWEPPEGVVVTLPNNETLSYGVTNVNGMPRVTSVSKPAGSGCLASTSDREYDARGNVIRNDDFDGTRSCHAFDSRNLETTRVEGLDKTANCATVLANNAVLPSGARKITTTWHPDWRLPVRVYEGKRVTTSVYNGQPDPFNNNAIAGCVDYGIALINGKPRAVACKRVEQATTDTNGAAGAAAALDTSVATRTWQYAYSNYGLPLTAKDPRGNTTTNAYYTSTTTNYLASADLQSVGNAKGHKTTFDKYDAAGRVVTMTDANGVQTDYSYDSRGRIASIITASRITSYGYDKVGNLTSVTHPDGSKTGMGYDDAGRLTSATDTRGNKVTYELDGSGNVVKQDIADPAGVLRRSIRQSFDALGRLQGMTLSDR